MKGSLLAVFAAPVAEDLAVADDEHVGGEPIVTKILLSLPAVQVDQILRGSDHRQETFHLPAQALEHVQVRKQFPLKTQDSFFGWHRVGAVQSSETSWGADSNSMSKILVRRRSGTVRQFLPAAEGPSGASENRSQLHGVCRPRSLGQTRIKADGHPLDEGSLAPGEAFPLFVIVGESNEFSHEDLVRRVPDPVLVVIVGHG